MNKKLLSLSLAPIMTLTPVVLSASCAQKSRIKEKEKEVVALMVKKQIKITLSEKGIKPNSDEAKKESKNIKANVEKAAKDSLEKEK